MKQDSKTIIIVRTIRYLNSVTNESYDPTQYANGTFTMLENLISKGYIFEDFKKVIDLKWNEWKGTKFQQYVRPATIFGNKFETYLNEQSPSQIKLTKLHNNVEKAKRTNWRLDKE